MAEFQIEIKECLRIKKEFTAMIEELKDYEKRLYAVKANLEKMSEYTGIAKRLARECQAVTEERGDVERLFQTFCDCVQCYETAEKNVKEQKIDWHFILDMAGLIPGAGALFDGVNTAWYAAEGDVENALLSGLAFLPAIGEGVGAGKASLKIGGKVMEHLDDAADVAKVSDKAKDAAKAADKAKDAGKAADVAKAADKAGDAAETAGKAKKGEENAGEIGEYVDEAIESGRGSKFQEVFDVADNYTLSDDTFNNHILDRHGPNSTYRNKSHFNADFDIRDGIDSTLKGNNFVVGPNTAGREGYIFKQTFANPIGTNSKGKPLYTLKVVIDESGNVITAFPQK